jgi:hypothetical protein
MLPCIGTGFADLLTPGDLCNQFEDGIVTLPLKLEISKENVSQYKF